MLYSGSLKTTLLLINVLLNAILNAERYWTKLYFKFRQYRSTLIRHYCCSYDSIFFHCYNIRLIKHIFYELNFFENKIFLFYIYYFICYMLYLLLYMLFILFNVLFFSINFFQAINVFIKMINLICKIYICKTFTNLKVYKF